MLELVSDIWRLWKGGCKLINNSVVVLVIEIHIEAFEKGYKDGCLERGRKKALQTLKNYDVFVQVSDKEGFWKWHCRLWKKDVGLESVMLKRDLEHTGSLGRNWCVSMNNWCRILKEGRCLRKNSLKKDVVLELVMLKRELEHTGSLGRDWCVSLNNWCRIWKAHRSLRQNARST